MSASLKVPSLGLLPDYIDALERGWSPSSIMGKKAADEELKQIASDADGFLAWLDDPQATGRPIERLDGSMMPRLPGFRRWIWDDGFCGSIGLRWSPGGSALPDWFSFGHIGYAVPSWKRGRGYATQALALLLPLARAQGLTWVELTTDRDNSASQRVVAKNGGYVLAEEDGSALHGCAAVLRWRIDL
jgi:predicted acetyltransferase